MPTLIEINNPSLIYCKKYDVHCVCVSCIKTIDDINPEATLKTQCERCKGPQEDDHETELTNIWGCDRHPCVGV